MRTKEQTEKIIADYIMTQSYSETARMNGCSHTTVRRIVNNNVQDVQKCVNVKKECTMSMEEYIRSKTELAQQIVNRYMLALLDEEKIERATSSQLTTAMGTVIDKFLLVSKNDGSTVEDLTPLARMLNDDSNTDN